MLLLKSLILILRKVRLLLLLLFECLATDQYFIIIPTILITTVVARHLRFLSRGFVPAVESSIVVYVFCEGFVCTKLCELRRCHGCHCQTKTPVICETKSLSMFCCFWIVVGSWLSLTRFLVDACGLLAVCFCFRASPSP